MSAQTILETHNLSYHAENGHPLIEQVNLSVSEGEIVVLAGPNGAGKSTLLKLLAGLLLPSQGQVKIFGSPLSELSARYRAQQIAFVDQREQADKRLTTIEYIALGRIPHQHNLSQDAHQLAVENAIKTVGLTHRRLHHLSMLSGGELQRAVIARALCQEPTILFLDEPTNHLDPKAKRDMLSLIASLGITTICVLHDLALIPQLADKTLLIEKAKVAYSGSTHETLSEAAVKQVFGVDLFTFSHPKDGQPLSALDIQIKKTNTSIKEKI